MLPNIPTSVKHTIWAAFIFLFGGLFATEADHHPELGIAPLMSFCERTGNFVATPFWESMEWKRPPTDPEFFLDPDMALIEKNFNQFCKHRSGDSLIPRIIHFIWLGSSIPPKACAVIESWRKHHPEWEFRIWTEQETKHFSWTTTHSRIAFEQGFTWAEKSDILRYEILYQFGGVYADTDMFCLKPVQDLLSNEITFFTGLTFNSVVKNHGVPLYVGTFLMGAIKGSSIMQYCLENFKTQQEAPQVPLYIRSGPGLVSKACHEGLYSLQENVLILPCTYFAPLPMEFRSMPWEEIIDYLRPESFGVHLWDASWWTKR